MAEALLPDASGQVAIPVADLPAGATRFFDVMMGSETISAFVARGRDGICRAWVNRCPHVPLYGLDFGDGEVVDPRDGLIVCANHGARFTPEDGLCINGPCRGDSLFAWTCNEVEGVAHVMPLAVPDGWPERVLR
jgi:nitrite reductase/ring-hydroxylating ferredoxin subunit